MLSSGESGTIPSTTHRRTSSRNTSSDPHSTAAIEFVSYGSIPPSTLGVSRNHHQSRAGGKRRMSSPNGEEIRAASLLVEEEDDHNHHHHRRRSTITDIAALFCPPRMGESAPIMELPVIVEPSEENLSEGRRKSTAVVPGAVLNLCSATLGAGILALPYALLQAGLIVGGLMLVLSALATERSIHILISVMHHYPQHATYEEMTQHVLKSRIYRATMEISMLLFCCGCAVGYIIAIGDILEQSSLLFVLNSRTWTLVFVWFVAMVPLSMLRNVQSLQYASAVGITAIATLILAAFIHYQQHHHHHSDGSDNESSSFSIMQLLHRWRHYGHPGYVFSTTDDNVQLSDFLWPLHGFVSILSSGPVFIFAFSCQANVCSIYDELDASGISSNSGHSYESIDSSVAGPTERAAGATKLHLMHRVTLIAVCICAMLYCSISVIALADFGTLVQPNMLSCYSADHGSFYIQVATAAMALAVVMAFPLNIFPARVTLLGLIAHSKPQENLNRWNHSSMDISPNDDLTEALLTDDEGRLPNFQTVDHHENGLHLLEVQPDSTGADVRDANHNTLRVQGPMTNDDIDSFDWTLHVVATLFLTGLTLCLALMLPNISVVFGLLGGTASSWLGFCVPGLLGMQLFKDHQNSTGEKLHNMMITSWALYIGGIAIGLLTTGVTIYKTLIGPSI